MAHPLTIKAVSSFVERAQVFAPARSCPDRDGTPALFPTLGTACNPSRIRILLKEQLQRAAQ